MTSVPLRISHYMPPEHGTHADFIAPRAARARAPLARRDRHHDLRRHDAARRAGQPARPGAPPHRRCRPFPRPPAAGPFPAHVDRRPALPCRQRGHRDAAAAASPAQPPRRGLRRSSKVLALHADAGGLLHTRDRADRAARGSRRLARPHAEPPDLRHDRKARRRFGSALAPPDINAALRSGAIDAAAMPWDVVLYTGSGQVPALSPRRPTLRLAALLRDELRTL